MSANVPPPKHALITGGSAGFGLALATAYARRGWRLTIVGRDRGRLAEAAETLIGISAASVDAFAADLSEPGQGERVIREAAAAGHGLDVVAHAAGRSGRGWLADTPRSEFESLLAINFLAAVELARASAEAVTASRGSLVLIGSLATHTAPAGLGAYPASKHPLAALAQQCRLEWGPDGHHTLLVCPGPIAREDAGARYDEQAEGLPEHLRKPAGGAKVRSIDPEELAERVVRACEHRKADLVLPGKARWLFALGKLSAAWGDWVLRKKMSAD